MRTPSALQAIRCTGALKRTSSPSASASGRLWLPSAMLGAGSSSTWAIPPRSRAATVSALFALEISVRASSASRAPGATSSPSRKRRAVMSGAAVGERAPGRVHGLSQLLVGDAVPPRGSRRP